MDKTKLYKKAANILADNLTKEEFIELGELIECGEEEGLFDAIDEELLFIAPEEFETDWECMDCGNEFETD